MTIRLCLAPGGVTRRVALLGGAMAIAAMVSDAHAQMRPAVRPPANRDPAQIYLMRGLFGIFSLGMDSLAAKLSAQGYNPTLLSWTDASVVVDQITAARRNGDNSPIILIGHSLGSNAVAGIATTLGQQNIPVDLVVTFDVTEPTRVSANVKQFVNFFQYNGFGRPVSAGAGFRGELQNIDLSSDSSLTHGNIDEAASLQAAVTERIFNITNQQMKTAAAAPKVRRP
jgi:hypothetical protein